MKNKEAMLAAVGVVAGCARALESGDWSGADASRDSTDGSVDGMDWTHRDTGGVDGNVTAPPEASVEGNDSGSDAALAPSACNGKTRVMTTADLFIGDFESGGLQGWYDFSSAGALNMLALGSPGALGTHHGGHLAATGLTGFGAGMGFGTGCWDTSALDGLSFWAKGTAGTDNKIQFQVAIPATHAVANGGDCVAKCLDHPSKQLVLTPDWKQYTVAFNELTQAGWGAPAYYKGIMMALNWVSVNATSVDFWVDEVALYKGVASTKPVGSGGGSDGGAD
jgi:hypothetical protein